MSGAQRLIYALPHEACDSFKHSWHERANSHLSFFRSRVERVEVPFKTCGSVWVRLTTLRGFSLFGSHFAYIASWALVIGWFFLRFWEWGNCLRHQWTQSVPEARFYSVDVSEKTKQKTNGLANCLRSNYTHKLLFFFLIVITRRGLKWLQNMTCFTINPEVL